MSIDDATPEEWDAVTKPQHYNTGKVECIDAMKAASRNANLQPFHGYLWLNAFKYLWRWPYKEKPVEDLKKSVWYIEKLIKEHENAGN